MLVVTAPSASDRRPCGTRCARGPPRRPRQRRQLACRSRRRRGRRAHRSRVARVLRPPSVDRRAPLAVSARLETRRHTSFPVEDTAALRMRFPDAARRCSSRGLRTSGATGLGSSGEGWDASSIIDDTLLLTGRRRRASGGRARRACRTARSIPTGSAPSPSQFWPRCPARRRRRQPGGGHPLRRGGEPRARVAPAGRARLGLSPWPSRRSGPRRSRAT